MVVPCGIWHIRICFVFKSASKLSHNPFNVISISITNRSNCITDSVDLCLLHGVSSLGHAVFVNVYVGGGNTAVTLKYARQLAQKQESATTDSIAIEISRLPQSGQQTEMAL